MSITSAIARITHRGHADSLMLPIVLAVAGSVFIVVALLYRQNRIPLFRWPGAHRQSDQPYRAMIAIEFASLIALALVFSPQTNPPRRRFPLNPNCWDKSWRLLDADNVDGTCNSAKIECSSAAMHPDHTDLQRGRIHRSNRSAPPRVRCHSSAMGRAVRLRWMLR